MADTRFYDRMGPFTVDDICKITGTQLVDPAQSKVEVHEISTLNAAQEGHLSVFHNRKYLEAFQNTKASACFVTEADIGKAPPGVVCLVTDKPYRAYAMALAAFYPSSKPEPRISPDARIDPTAKIGKNCMIEAGAIIRARAEIGDNTQIYANAVINEGVIIGQGCHIDVNVYISHALIGNGVKVYPNTTLGKTGFGFDMDEAGYIPVPQVGRLIIEDGVEIGANCNIDRGSLEDTVIGAGSRIDSLVQFGHNVQLGKGCVIVSQVGIAGSTKLGNYVVAAGQVGIAGHLTIGDGARIGAKAGLMRDVPPGETVIGAPAVPVKQWQKQIVTIERLVKDRQKKVKGG